MAQEIWTIEGQVLSDLTSRPLPGVFVTAFHGEKTCASVYTDENGCFSLKCTRPVTAVSATLLGYKITRLEVASGSKRIELRLTPAKLQLQAAQVSERAVQEHGDTLSYIAQSFSDGTERVLGELLQKLPGISINPSSGTIYHNGRPISKFYVEGMDLMGNRYGVVTQNLSSDQIARVEIFRRHQPIRALQSIDRPDQSAINIILKESERNVWSLGLNGLLGAPPVPLFSAQAMLTRFAKSSQDLFLIKGNNIGNDILRELQEQQYFGKARWFVVDTQNADADFATELRPGRTELPLPQRYWYDNLSGLASLNHLSKTGPDSQVKLSLNGAAERFRETSLTREEIRLDGAEVFSIEEQRSLSDLRYYADLSASFEHNGAERFFSEEFKAAGQWRDALSSLSTDNSYSQQYSLPSFKLENQLRLTTRRRESRALTFTSDTKFVRNAHQAKYKTASYQADQELTERVFRSENAAGLDFRTGALRWNGTAGLDLTYNSTCASLSGLSGQGIPQTRQEFGVFSAQPHLSLRSSFYLGASQWTASLPAALSLIAVRGQLLCVPVYSPSLTVALRLSPSWDISTSASFAQSHSAPESLMDAFIMQDWRTLAQRDSLRRSRRISTSAQIRYSDNSNMFFASLAGQYARLGRNRVSAHLYSEQLTLRSFLPVVLASDSYSVTGKLSKYFGASVFVAELSSGALWTDSDEYLQGRAVHYQDFSLTSELSLRFHPVQWLAASLNGVHTLTDIRGEVPVRARTIQLKGEITLRPVQKLSLNILGYGLWQQVPGAQISNTPLLDASALWEFERFEIVLTCRNLLGCQEFIRESFNAWHSISTISRLCGRQFLLSVRASL